MGLVYSIPAAILLLGTLAIAIAAALGAQIFVHRRFRQDDFVAHNEVGGIIIAVCGSLYAVILGFLTVAAWQHFQEARQVVVAESDANIDAWHTAVGLPPPIRERVRNDMITYAGIMVDKEWPLMRHGQYDPRAAIISMDAMDAAGALNPANLGQSNAQNATMQQLDVMHDARQRRISMNDSGVTSFEWLVLLFGAICITCFCWIFGLRSRIIHLLMTSTIVILIVSILVLLFELQYPFRSAISIAPTAWTDAIDHIHQMQDGNLSDMKM
jgi:hypothetical protein